MAEKPSIPQNIPPEQSKEYKINRYFFLGIILIFAIFLFTSLIKFFTAFLSAVIFYVLGKPSVEWLIKKKKWKKSRAALLIIFVSFFIILLPVTLLVTLLYEKVVSVIRNPGPIIDNIKHFGEVVHEKTGFQVVPEEALNSIPNFAATVLSEVVNQGLGLFATITMMYFFLYFMIVNTNRMEAAVVFYLPFKKDKINMFGNELVAQTFSNAVGVPLIALAQGLLGYAAYRITGIQESGFWGVITGFSSILPIVGSGIVWAPIGIYQLIIGHNWQGIFILAWGAVIMGLADNVIRFMLAKRMADVHPIVTVLGVIMGLKYFGISGLIFGPVLISYFLLLLRIYWLEYQKPTFPKPVKTRELMPSYMQPFLGVKKTKKK